MTTWSVLPFGPLVWFGGIIALAVIGFCWIRSWQAPDALSQAQPAAVSDNL
jgi:hypothetical protein